MEEFQFLLVRLKEKESEQAESAKEFQFLLVRLKVDKYIGKELIVIFQFLLVRLKAMDYKVLLILSLNFNSFWYD